MQGNLFLFVGDNDFAIRQERLRWIDEFSRKYGGENIIRHEGGGLDLPRLLDEIAIGPFLSPKRLVVVDGIPKFQKGELETVCASIHPDTVLLLVHRKMPGRRLSLPRELPEACTLRTFGQLKSRELQQWLESWAQQHGAGLSPDARSALQEHVGEDQEALAGEIVKLAAACTDGVITADLVQRLAVPSSEGVIWRMTDNLCAGKRAAALSYARSLLERGGDTYGMWNVLLGMLKNLVVVAAAVQEGRKSTDIAERFGIHPYAVKSLLGAAQRVDMDRLRSFLESVSDDDIALKTGGYRATDEAPQELQALIDRFILTCP